MFIEVDQVKLEYDSKSKAMIQTDHILKAEKYLTDYTLIEFINGSTIVINQKYEDFVKKGNE